VNASPALRTTGLLGLSFADATPAQVLAWLLRRPADAPFGYVVTPNADHLVRLARDPALLDVYAQAELRLLDSRVVARLAWLCGLPAPPVVTGSDLTASLLAAVRDPVTIIGLDPSLVPNLGLTGVAHHNPPMGFEHDPAAFAAAIDFVLAHPARFTLLAVGSPRQERLAATIAATGRATGTGLCIGASLAYRAGAAVRAPTWMQRAGLEWLHRLAREPVRLGRRYLLDDPAIILLLARERWRQSASG
jgi:UDP-N-acetyl-D-mannosaminuronic acid transferase (WecB/TagA/CpsF family)